MDSTILPLLAATATAAGVFGWLTSQPRSLPMADIDGGGVLGDMYNAATRNVVKAKKATTDMLTNAFSNKDEYKVRAAEKYRQIQAGLSNKRRELDAELDRMRMRNRA